MKINKSFYLYFIFSILTLVFLFFFRNNEMLFLSGSIFSVGMTLVLGLKYGKVVHEYNKFILNTNRFLNNISGTGDQILGSCSQIGESANEQSSAVIQTGTASDEISAMIGRNTKNITQVNNSVKLINDIVSKSTKSTRNLDENLKKSIKANQKVTELLNNTTVELTSLINQFDEVVSKTAVINDIVFQTKLLSFNASVEAARAGEHGKGFSVVAEEIGNLATMSGNSATGIQQTLEVTENQVNTIIQNIKNSSQELTQVLNNQNQETNKILGEFNQNFSEVDQKVKNIVDQVEEITTASQEQNKGVNEMRDSIHTVNESIQRNTLVVGQTTSLANVLGNEIERYLNVLKGKRENNKISNKQIKIQEIPWDKKYEMGIESMDGEHQVLLAKINHLIRDMNDNPKAISKSFEALKQFTLEHFRHEEAFMEQTGYSSLESHKRVHKNLIEVVLKFERDINSGNLNKVKLASFLKNWLFTHIMGVDTKYAENANKQKWAA